MFGKDKSSPVPLAMGAEKFDTVIGRRAEVHGCLRVQESVRIDGKVVGNIEAPAGAALLVMIGPHGEVHGDVLASRIIVAGKVAGNIHAYERVELLASSLIQGDIKYASMAVEHGAKLMGLMLQVDTADAPEPSDADAQQAIRKAQAPGATQ